MSGRAVRGTYPADLRAVAAYGLAGTLLSLPPAPLDDRAFARLHGAVRLQKLTGLFWAAIRDGALPATASQCERAEESHLRALAGVLMLERLLLHTVQLLGEARIPVRVLKGAASSQLDYPDPALRTYGDIDLLVPGDHYEDAVRLLVSEGARRRYPEPRAGFDRRFGKGSSLRTSDGLEIDLHRTFTMGPYGESLALEQLWQRSETFSIGGTACSTLTQEGRLVHAAYHATLGDRRPQLVPLRDIAQMLLMKQPDWEQVSALMRASSGEAVVARAIRNAWGELHLADVLFASAWAASYRLNHRDAADLSVYGASSNYAVRSLAAVRSIPIGQRPRYVFALAFPERAYLEGRHASIGSRLRHGISDIRDNRRRS